MPHAGGRASLTLVHMRACGRRLPRAGPVAPGMLSTLCIAGCRGTAVKAGALLLRVGASALHLASMRGNQHTVRCYSTGTTHPPCGGCGMQLARDRYTHLHLQ